MNGGGKCNSKPIKGEAIINKDILNNELLRLRVMKNIDIQEIKELVKQGADVDVRSNYYQRTFLHDACYERRNTELVKNLIDICADVNARDKDNNTPLHLAIRTTKVEIIKLLIDKGADVNARNNDGYTPLILAMINISRAWNHTEVVMALIDKGADVNSRDPYGSTPLHYAWGMGITRIPNMLLVSTFIDKGSDVNARDNNGRTLIHLSLMFDTRRNDMDYYENDMVYYVNYLIKKGADVNVKDNNEDTPLHYAFKTKLSKIAKLLIEAGANINAKNAYGKIPQNYVNPIEYEQFGLELSRNAKEEFIKDGVYELRKYKDVYVPIMIIPRGTLLFRTRVEGRYALPQDFCGINDNNDKYCLNKNFNVFFYPYPAYWGNDFKIFVVEKTLKIVNLINPSYLSREVKSGTTRENYDFIQSCLDLEPDFCEGQAGTPYDPCLSEEFLKENPDIAGMISLAELDTSAHKKKYTNLNKYNLLHSDVRGVIGLPELILYPKQTRQITDKNWSEQECVDENNNYSYLIDSENYEVNIMESLLNPKGYNIKRSGVQSPFTQKDFDKIHVTLYNPLKMYVVWEYLEENYKKDCVPINWSAKSKLSQFQNDINKLNDGLYKKNVTTLKKLLRFDTGGGKPKKRKPKRNKTRKKSNK
jgi:ankyrin repeat protein